jgi:putative NADH-flavin reductase
MRILVVGAAGRTGRLVVAGALARGHEVTAMARGAGRLADLEPEVRVVEGDVANGGAVERALEGAAAVISVLAIAATEEPTTELSDAVRMLVRQMVIHGPRRLVVTANTTVLDDRDVKPPYAVVALEHRRNLRTLRASDLRWTMVVTGFLDDEPASDGYDVVLDEAPPGRRISRQAFADACLDALLHEGWAGHVVAVSG